MVQGVAGVAPNDGDIHIPWGRSGPLYVHISLGKIDLLSYFIKIFPWLILFQIIPEKCKISAC